MSRSKLWLIPVLLSSVALSLVSIAQAQNAVVLAGHSVSDVNIRATPSLSSSPIAVLPASEKVTAIGRNVTNNWIQIQYGATTGWVAAWVTVYSGDTSLLPVTHDIVSEPTTGPDPFVLTSPYNVNIRSEPQIGAAYLGRLGYNAKASAIGRNEASSWVFIEYEGIEGWVAAWLTILSNDINALPVVAGGSGPSPTTSVSSTVAPTPPLVTTPLVTTPLVTTTLVTTTLVTTTLVTTTLVTTTPVSPALPPSEGGITVQSPSKTNIRSAPSLNASVIDVLPFAGAASVIGRNAGGNWLQVTYGSTVGWVARWVVVTSDDTSNVTITSDATEIGPTIGVITGHGIYDVFIRSGPGLNNGQVAVLPPAGKAELLARTTESNWIKVRYQQTEGWVAAWVIVASADLLNLPVE